MLGMLRVVHWAGWSHCAARAALRCLRRTANHGHCFILLRCGPVCLPTALAPPGLYGTRSACRRFPLPFTVHLPLHLLCLWVLTAGTTVAHTLSGSATSVGGALLAQLLLGFLLSSCLVYRREAHLRASFLNSRRAAACLAAPGSRQKRPHQAPVSAN